MHCRHLPFPREVRGIAKVQVGQGTSPLRYSGLETGDWRETQRPFHSLQSLRKEGHISTEGLFAFFRVDMDAFHFPFSGGGRASGLVCRLAKEVRTRGGKLRPGAKLKEPKEVCGLLPPPPPPAAAWASSLLSV